MTASTAKRILLYRFDGRTVEAVVNAGNYLAEDRIDLITANGSVQTVPYRDIKAVCFAKEPGKANLFTEGNLFERRPKVPGLWARFTFRDGDKLDGVLSHDLLEWPARGYTLTPPRAGLSRQLVFIPREALSVTEFQGVVGAASSLKKKRPRRTDAETGTGQLTMFNR